MIFKLIFIAIINSVGQLATYKVKCISLNKKPYLPKLMFIESNQDEIRHYPFLVN